MRVLLDNEPFDARAERVGDVIDEVAEAARRRGRVIVDVVVDGAPWEGETLERSDLRSRRADEIRLESEELGDLVRRTLGDGAAALEEACFHQEEAARLLQRDEAPDALDHLGEALGIWIAVHEALATSVEALGLDVGATRVGDVGGAGGEPMCLRLDELGRHLGALRRALEAKDEVSLADALLYELPDVIGRWREMIDAVAAAAPVPRRSVDTGPDPADPLEESR